MTASHIKGVHSRITNIHVHVCECTPPPPQPIQGPRSRTYSDKVAKEAASLWLLVQLEADDEEVDAHALRSLDVSEAGLVVVVVIGPVGAGEIYAALVVKLIARCEQNIATNINMLVKKIGKINSLGNNNLRSGVEDEQKIQ